MRRPRRPQLALIVGATAALVVGCNSVGSTESSWTPEGDVTMVVPFAAGGGSDNLGRSVGSALEEVESDMSVTVENRDGGSGAVGYSYFLGKAGDPSYLLASDPALLALPITEDVEFDYTDFTPIMKLGEDSTLMVVDSSSPYDSCSDVAEAAKSERVVAGISGITGADNVVFTLTEQDQGVEFDRVPFESGAELLTALLGGQVDIASLNPSEVLGQLKSGDVKPLCVFAEKRYDYPELKDIPTAKEQGIDVAFSQYRGLIAPGGISDSEKDAWIEVAKKFADSDAYDKYVETSYVQPNVAYGDDFGDYLKENSDLLEEAIG